MKIVALEAENIKHLKVINIRPDGSLIVVGGNNAAGKSCLLDSIEYALRGAGSIPIKPIRDGQEKARVVLDLGDIEVTRTFTKKGTNLVVKNKKGVTFASPQAMLDQLVGELTFDPLEFSKMEAKKQAEVLKKLVGLNFDKLDVQYKKLFEERTIVNRQGKEKKANLDNTIRHEDVPDTEVSIHVLGEKYAQALEHNQVIEINRRELKSKTDELIRVEREIEKLRADIGQIQKDLDGQDEVDAKVINRQMEEAESINSKVRANKVFDRLYNEVTELRKQSGSLGEQMSKIAATKNKALAKAKFPIDDLDIDSDGVTFDDIPFSQCSSAQKIKISVAIGLAMNPKLRILLIREGSLLDEKNLEMVAEMAEEADAQVWLERVSKGSECSVILEDGEIKEAEVTHA